MCINYPNLQFIFLNDNNIGCLQYDCLDMSSVNDVRVSFILLNNKMVTKIYILILGHLKDGGLFKTYVSSIIM